MLSHYRRPPHITGGASDGSAVSGSAPVTGFLSRDHAHVGCCQGDALSPPTSVPAGSQQSQAPQSHFRFASARAWCTCCRAAPSCLGIWPITKAKRHGFMAATPDGEARHNAAAGRRTLGVRSPRPCAKHSRTCPCSVRVPGRRTRPRSSRAAAIRRTVHRSTTNGPCGSVNEIGKSLCSRK